LYNICVRLYYNVESKLSGIWSYWRRNSSSLSFTKLAVLKLETSKSNKDLYTRYWLTMKKCLNFNYVIEASNGRSQHSEPTTFLYMVQHSLNSHLTCIAFMNILTCKFLAARFTMFSRSTIFLDFFIISLLDEFQTYSLLTLDDLQISLYP